MSDVLRHRVTTYNSAEIVDEVCLGKGPSPNASEFEGRLLRTLAHCETQGNKGVWLELARSRAELVPAAVRCGFEFHHCTTNKLVLTAWLLKDQPSKLPPGPTHHVGVGGFVINDKDEVLVIKERSGPSAKLVDFWKLPGGLVDPQEDLRDAVVRELKEETGIDVEFLRVSSIQEIHTPIDSSYIARAGSTDFYSICVCKVRDANQPIVMQESEIAACKWMPIDEFLSSKYYDKEGTVYHKMFTTAAEVARGVGTGTGLEVGKFKGYSGMNSMYYDGGVQLKLNNRPSSRL
jgi:ADP-ribose pyrophosphatase YjhB (NUDIX family)